MGIVIEIEVVEKLSKMDNQQCYYLKSLLSDYGKHSETERMLVYNDWLITMNMLKIQSTPLGNIWDSSGR